MVRRMTGEINHPMAPDRPYWYAEFGAYESIGGSMFPCWYPKLVMVDQFIAPRLDVNFPDRVACEAYIREFLGAGMMTADGS